MPTLIHQTNEYLATYFNTHLLALNEELPSLPIQLRNRCIVSLAKLNGLHFYVIEAKDDLIFQKNNMVLFNNLLNRLTKYPPLFLISRLSSSAIQELTHQRISHIVPYERTYIHQLMMHQEKLTKASPIGAKVLGILPSNIVARYLEGEIPRIFTSANIKIDVSRAAVTRAMQELEEMGLISIKKNGRINENTFLLKRKDIWGYKQTLLSPLASDVYVFPLQVLEQPLILSGESALSIYTLMSPPTRPCYAVYLQSKDRASFAITPTTINTLLPQKIIDNTLHKVGNKELIELQIYPYAPIIKEIQNTKVISEVALALSGYKQGEPRVQSSFNELDEAIYSKLRYLDSIDFD